MSWKQWVVCFFVFAGSVFFLLAGPRSISELHSRAFVPAPTTINK